MAQHRAPRTTHRVRTLALSVLATLAGLFIIGAVASANTPALPAPAPTLPVCSTFEVSMQDIAHRHGLELRLACDDAESLGVDTPAALVTVTADPATVTSTPAPVTQTLAPSTDTVTPAPVTETAEPATVTEYPADVTETAAPETITVQGDDVTETAHATVTATVGPDVTVSADAGSGMPHCASEDGSTPGQVFPCVWDGSVDGNGTGDSYVLTESL